MEESLFPSQFTKLFSSVLLLFAPQLRVQSQNKKVPPCHTPMLWNPYRGFTFTFLLAFVGFGSSLCAIHSLPSSGEKIGKDSVSLNCIGWQSPLWDLVSWKSVRSCWRDPLVNCSVGGRSKYSKEMNQDVHLHLMQITAVQRKSECSQHGQAGILWPSDCRVQNILISFLLEASKLGEE